jgi:tRNA 2-selenouridine synthase
MESISFSKALELKDKVFVDVRTPLEFSKDHITGAVNIPVLSDEQRVIVGTIYKTKSAAKAVDKGIGFFSEKLPEIVGQLREYKGSDLIAYCWRGGMRSRAFVSLLRSLNFNILQLQGGYKSFRNYVRETLYNFDIAQPLFCIYGATGTGKTEIIRKLSPFSIDLEGLANHRSSLFGHIGLAPRTQKRFENMLLEELFRVSKMPYFFLEGESRKIGNINLPDVIYKKMNSCNFIRVFSDITTRVNRIVTEYFNSDEKIDQIKQVLDSNILMNKLGKTNLDYLKECMQNGDYENLVKLLLEKYYDPLYLHSQKKLNIFVDFRSINIDETVTKIASYVKDITTDNNFIS